MGRKKQKWWKKAGGCLGLSTRRDGILPGARPKSDRLYPFWKLPELPSLPADPRRWSSPGQVPRAERKISPPASHHRILPKLPAVSQASQLHTLTPDSRVVLLLSIPRPCSRSCHREQKPPTQWQPRTESGAPRRRPGSQRRHPMHPPKPAHRDSHRHRGQEEEGGPGSQPQLPREERQHQTQRPQSSGWHGYGRRTRGPRRPRCRGSTS